MPGQKTKILWIVKVVLLSYFIIQAAYTIGYPEIRKITIERDRNTPFLHSEGKVSLANKRSRNSIVMTDNREDQFLSF